MGATTGGVLGALGGLLVGLGALAIPGIGPVLAAGPLVAALGPIVGGTATGTVIGAGAGAVAGALVGLGIPEDEARVYEQRFQEGGILVTVKAGANRYNEAEQILRNAGRLAGLGAGLAGQVLRAFAVLHQHADIIAAKARALQLLDGALRLIAGLEHADNGLTLSTILSHLENVILMIFRLL